MKLKALIGSGDKIALFTVPFIIIGMILNFMYPSFFSAGDPSAVVVIISAILLVSGLVIWGWSVALIATKAARNELITSGPYSLVRHPLYTGVSLLVLPSAGLLLNSWFGALIGISMYVGARLFSSKEEKILASTFGSAWDEYCKKVKIPWL